MSLKNFCRQRKGSQNADNGEAAVIVNLHFMTEKNCSTSFGNVRISQERIRYIADCSSQAKSQKIWPLSVFNVCHVSRILDKIPLKAQPIAQCTRKPQIAFRLINWGQKGTSQGWPDLAPKLIR